jgi:hypothetical protein
VVYVGDNGYVTDGNRHKNREKTQYVKFCLCGALANKVTMTHLKTESVL